MLFNLISCCLVHGNYEELRFIFNTSSFPPDYRSHSWLYGLVGALLEQLRSNYLSEFPEGTLDAEGIGFRTPPAVPAAKAHTRQSISQELFYADINLLPRSLKKEDMQSIHDVSQWDPFLLTS